MAKIFKHKTDVASKQRQLARAIKRARHIALLPFVASN
jgi:ribosomal protein S18